MTEEVKPDLVTKNEAELKSSDPAVGSVEEQKPPELSVKEKVTEQQSNSSQNGTSQVEGETVSGLEAKIIKQVEYYFGDTNMTKDLFLKDKVKEDNGWVTIECLTTFNRLKALSANPLVIVEALKKSTTGLLEVDVENLKVRRDVNKPVPDADDPVFKLSLKKRSLYLKGFPLDYNLDQVEEFFAKNNVNVVSLFMRRNMGNHSFKGSVFLECSSEEEASKLIERKEELKIGEENLIVMAREEYFGKKAEERKKMKEEIKSAKQDNAKAKITQEIQAKKGCIIHIDGLDDGDITRETLKGDFGSEHMIAWIDYKQSDTQGYIRFADPGAAKTVMDNLSDEIKEKYSKSKLRVLEGEEEENYLKMVVADLAKSRENNNHGHRGDRGGRGGRGGRGRGYHKGGKRHRPWEDTKKEGVTDEKKPAGEHTRFEDADDESPAKKPRVEVAET